MLPFGGISVPISQSQPTAGLRGAGGYGISVSLQFHSENTGELQKYQKGMSYEQQILDAYSGYGAGQTSLKMIPGGHWEYTTNLYLHGGGDNVLVEYTKGTDITEFTQRYIYPPVGGQALGSTRLIVDETGEILAYFHYLPFGDVVSSFVNMGGMDYRYTGQEWDNEVGLHNYRARLYDSDLGRFYAVDPAGQTAGPFTYVRNNPISYIDPNGLRWKPSNSFSWYKAWNEALEKIGWVSTKIWASVMSLGEPVSDYKMVNQLVFSTIGSYAETQYDPNAEFETKAGPFSYSWEQGEWDVSNPFTDPGALWATLDWMTLGSDLVYFGSPYYFEHKYGVKNVRFRLQLGMVRTDEDNLKLSFGYFKIEKPFSLSWEIVQKLKEDFDVSIIERLGIKAVDIGYTELYITVSKTNTIPIKGILGITPGEFHISYVWYGSLFGRLGYGRGYIDSRPMKYSFDLLSNYWLFMF